MATTKPVKPTKQQAHDLEIIKMLSSIEWEGSDYWVTEYVDTKTIPDKKVKELVVGIRELYDQLKIRLEELEKEVDYWNNANES